MIIDTLEHIGRYADLGKSFARAAEFLGRTDLRALTPGSAQVDGSKVYYTLQENTLSHGAPAWEAHRRYADIQLILRGRERLGWGIAGRYGSFDAEKDFLACEAVNGFEFTLSAGQFAVFLPGEPHAPGLFSGEERCLKLVIKVLAEDAFPG